MGISMEAQKEAILEKSKKTMSVLEMRRLFGLKKTDSLLAGASEFLPDIYCERTDAC